MPPEDPHNGTFVSPADLPVPLIVIDADGRIVHANGLAAARLGLRADQAAGTLLGSYFVIGEQLAERLEAALLESDRAAIDGLAINGDGRAGHVDLIVQKPETGTQFIVILLDAEPRLARQRELERLQRALADSEQQRTKMDVLQRELSDSAEPPRIIGASAPVLQMHERISRVAPTSATVLIHGESGSGKELVARALHAGSPRAHRAIISVNCAAMPETLLESELFGHERGAFTGADRQRLGKFELADGGTLFLDEIGELSPPAQAKLLRVLQEGAFERVGGTETVHVDVRLVAATHRNLAKMVERNRFREDLFYRLNVFRIDVPPLRDRREDIRDLAEFFHDMHARRMAKEVLPISERSMRRMLTYKWPGNVRELENAIERATLLASGSELEVELPESPVPSGSDRGGSGASRDTANLPRDVLLDLTIDQLSRLQIMHALETREYKVFGNDGAAEKLGINPQTLLSRMDKLGIPRPRAMRKGRG